MLETIDEIQWSDIAQPEWNSSYAVPAALRGIIAVESEIEAQKAYHRMLYAVGNNHAGTYYPVALYAIPFLAEMLGHDKTLVRQTGLNVLIDLLGSFAPDEHFKTIQASSGLEVSLEVALRESVATFRPQIAALGSSATEGSQERKLVIELISQLDGHG